MPLRIKDWRDAYALAQAAGRDAGIRSAACNGRTQWDEEDWNHACETFAGMMQAFGYDPNTPPEDDDTGRVRPGPQSISAERGARPRRTGFDL